MGSMRKAAALSTMLFALAAMPAQAAPLEARNVTVFLAACAKDKKTCADEIADRVTAADSPDRSGDVCLNDDQRDEPGTISKSILRWLTGRREVAKKPPGEAIDQAAAILYPCIN
jgi:hypothetical protein